MDVSLTEAFLNLKLSEFYTLTYWGIGVMATIIILFQIPENNDPYKGTAEIILVVITFLIVTGVEIYHSHDLLTREAVREKKRLAEIRMEESRIKGCRFDLADAKASKFIRSTGFIIVRTHQPSYLALPNNDTDKISCQAYYNYTVKVREYNNYTGETSISNKLHQVSLDLDQYGEGYLKSYELVQAIIEDLTTKKSMSLLE